jgi:hypothetical protein
LGGHLGTRSSRFNNCYLNNVHANYTFFYDVVRPWTNNTVDLGDATFRFRGIYGWTYFAVHIETETIKADDIESPVIEKLESRISQLEGELAAMKALLAKHFPE